LCYPDSSLIDSSHGARPFRLNNRRLIGEAPRRRRCPVARSSAAMLAPPWQAATDPRSGAVFYFNPQSGQTTWTPPYAQTMGYGQMPMPYAPNPYAPNPYAPNPYAQPYPQPYQQSYQQPVPQNPYAQAAHPYHTAPRPAAAAAPAPAPAPQAEEQPAYMSAPDPETDPEVRLWGVPKGASGVKVTANQKLKRGANGKTL
jgi:hypothetical protein